jgi:hypothetical protein
MMLGIPNQSAVVSAHGKASNKHIREAIGYAQERGWTFTKASGRAHIFGTLWCPRGGRDGCRFRVYSTPRSPEDHARRIRRAVDGCPH